MRVHCKIHISIPLLFTACIGMHSTYRETIVAGSVRGNTASILSLAASSWSAFVPEDLPVNMHQVNNIT